MVSAHLAQDWADRLERFKQLDITVAQFCLQECVTQASYFYWQRKLRRGEIASNDFQVISAARFVPVTVSANATPKPPSLMTVDLPGGIRIRFEVPADNQNVGCETRCS